MQTAVYKAVLGDLLDETDLDSDLLASAATESGVWLESCFDDIRPQPNDALDALRELLK